MPLGTRNLVPTALHSDYGAGYLRKKDFGKSFFFSFFLAELTKLDPWGSCSQCDGATSKLVGYPEFQLLMDVAYHSPGEPHCGISIVPVQRLVVYY